MQIIRRLNRIYHTIKYLKAEQIFYQIWYRVKYRFRRSETKAPNFIDGKPLNFPIFVTKAISLNDRTFTFLNLSKDYSSLESVNWDESSFGKLWTYNLNYFDFLLQPDLKDQTAKLLIESYVLKYPSLSIAKEPYTISLRCVNWIKWILHKNTGDEKFLSLFNICLSQQYQSLKNHIEYHLQGNHLLENAYSLLFGAFYFSDLSLYKKANKILQRELNEQILPDGAHFELSPMYHQIILERVLDCVNLLQNNSYFPNQDDLLSLLRKKATSMLGWLLQISFSNGDIPMVNDAALGFAPSAGQLQVYSNKLGVSTVKQTLRESGYRMYRNKYYELMVDYGIPGPDYIPGHAHADIFNFVLYVQGRPVIVDTGTSTYDACKIRIHERATAAHNTVQVNGLEQSDTWAIFRMGRRAKPVIVSETPQSISGYHKGFVPNMHYREFRIEEKYFTVTDHISGPDHDAVAYLHFAPGIQIQIINNSIISEFCKLRILGSQKIVLDQFDMAYGFNRLIKAPLIKIYFHNKLENKFEI